MSGAILKITDGSSINTIDLLGIHNGYILCDWRPTRPEFEYALDRNWFSGVETPAIITQKPSIDTFTFRARDVTADALIAHEQKLSRILKMASLYWTNSRVVQNPFYIIAKNRDETETRYATIFSTQLHDSSNPYSAPFFAINPLDVDLIVPISHGEWLDYPPDGNGLVMYENVTSILNSELTGRSGGAHFLNDDARVFLTNSLSHEALSHIFYADDTTQNLLDLPEEIGYDLFSSAGGVYTYFGMSMPSAAYYPVERGWPALWFNITTPAAAPGLDDPQYQWEIYLDGIGWSVVVVEDGTSQFTVPGTVIFDDIKQKWGNTTVGSVDGFWVRVIRLGLISQVPAVSVKAPAVMFLPYFDVLLAAGDEYLSDPGEAGGGTPPPPINEFENPVQLRLDITQGVTTPPSFWMHFSGAKTIGDVHFYSWWIDADSIPSGNYYGEWVSVKFEGDGAYEVSFNGEVTDQLNRNVSIHSFWDLDPVWKAAPDFTVDTPVHFVGDTLTFDPSISVFDTPTDTIASSKWDFGDGVTIVTNSATIPIVTHAYTESGSFTVWLQLTYTGGRVINVLRGNEVIAFDNIEASFTSATRRGFAGFDPGFDASASSTTTGTITSYEWNFGDGTTGTGVKPVKVYDTQGVYSVTLKVTDSSTNTNEITLSNYIYVDSKLLYPGDSGIYLSLGFQPIITQWDDLSPNKLYIGARSLITSDDYGFQGFVPVYGPYTQHPSLVRWWGGTVYEQENSTAYTGWVLRKSHSSGVPPLVLGTEEVYASLDFGIEAYKRYRGAYRVFIRMDSDVEIPSGDIYFSVGTSARQTTSSYSQVLSKGRGVTDRLSPSYVTLLDLGSVVIGGNEAVTQTLDIYWQPFLAKADQEIRLFDLVLIPQDEWYAEISFLPYDLQYGQEYGLTVSSITPSGDLEAKITKGSDEIVELIPTLIPSAPLSLLGKDIRFTVLSARYDASEAVPHPVEAILQSNFRYFFEVSAVTKVNRYFGSRGSN